MRVSKEELVAVLAQFNSWWRREAIADLPKWRRAAFRELHAWMTVPPAPRVVLLSGVIRKEALLTSQIEGTQATLTDLFDGEAGFKVSNTDGVEEVTNYLRAFR